MKDDALKILKKYYGYDSFRPGQWEIVDNVLAGHDTLVLMPTGGGKSLCYQIPSLMLPGVTLVVSPLIALMIDQVSALNANGIPAAAVHSNQEEALNRDILNRACQGKFRLVYISPERLMSDLDNIITHLPLSLVAIDEAHCISQWGHDFRPVYLSLKAIKEKLPEIPVMALTATADRLTRSDIAEALGLRDPFAWIGSFDRPNISLTVIPDPGKKGRLKVISDLVFKYAKDAGIVYCISRRKTEQMHAALSELGIRSACYHAGMSPADRMASQRAFLNGDVQVVCATVAFGMGIDKSNIRWVVHNNIPGNIESYYQEIGRAGRDGLPAEAILFYNYADIITRRSFAEESGLSMVNGEKLDFMQRYAEASVCRRRILLSYFSEETVCDCGNCDNCRRPRPKFDGTVLAQKAISAVIRVKNAEAINTIIDILRASSRSDIIRKGYHSLPTYGVGRDLGSREWHSYILQMIQLGLLEVAYDDGFHLRPTPLGMKVVRGQQRIELSRYEEYDFHSRKKAMASEPVVEIPSDQRLLAVLKDVRKDVAALAFLPPHVVFSDPTLQEMAEVRPLNIDELLKISGVTEVKAVRFGRDFIAAIRKFEKKRGASVPRGTSQKESLILYNSGMSPDDIANLKGIKLPTVYSHLTQWVEEGKLSDCSRLITDADYRRICRAYDENPDTAQTRLLADGVPLHLIRLALALRNK